MTYPIEANTPLQPPPAWPYGISATAQLAATEEAVNYSQSGAVIPAGTTASKTVDLTVDESYESQLVLAVKITAVSGGDTLTVQINGKTASGDIYPILTSTALATISTTPLRVGSGFTALANLTADDMLPNDIQVVCTVAGAGAIAYGVDLVIG
jgi:hypothetical protein